MKYFENLNRKFGEAVRNKVVSDFANGRKVGPNGLSTAITLISALIVATPLAVGAVGIAVILLNLDSLPAIAIGALLLGLGYYLLPTKARNKEETIRRNQAPKTFEFLDQISNLLDAPKVTGIHINCELNAYMAEFSGQERILGIGAPLWLAADPSERLALISHEVAHLINNDPARTKLPAQALQTLSRWHDLTHPPAVIDQEYGVALVVDDRGIIGQVVGAIFGGLIAAVAQSFEKLIYADTQRAEYLADISASSVAGSDAVRNLLKKIILSPLGVKVIEKTYYNGSSDIEILDLMAAAIKTPDPTEESKLYSEAIETSHTVDSSHPPTRYRMELVAAVEYETPRIDPSHIDWEMIDSELAASFEKEKKKLLNDILVQ